MAESTMVVGTCIKINGGSIAIGNGAGSSHTTGTGGIYLGYMAGAANQSGASSIAIGANSTTGTTSGDCIAIGYGASVLHNSASSQAIAIGADSLCSSLNTLVLGNQPTSGPFTSSNYGTTIQEFGRGHQNYWKVSIISGFDTFITAEQLMGGWLAIEDITINSHIRLPSLANILAFAPNFIINSCGELIISNYNEGGYEAIIYAGDDTQWLAAYSNIKPNTLHHIYYRYDVWSPGPYYVIDYCS